MIALSHSLPATALSGIGAQAVCAYEAGDSSLNSADAACATPPGLSLSNSGGTSKRPDTRGTRALADLASPDPSFRSQS